MSKKTATLVIILLVGLMPAAATAQQAGLWPRGAGGSLKLVRHDVQVRIHQPLAEITVTQEFDNPHAVQLEAYYYYPVPRGATVTNLALWVNGKRREARVLERQKAREIYQGIVNEKRDPALVERLSDELFRIRIFPVPARGRQRVELRFAQPLELVERGHYRLTLRRPPGPTCHVLRLGVELLPAATPERAWLVGYPGRLAREGRLYRLPLPATQRSFARPIELHYVLPARSAGDVAVAARRGGDETLFVAELPRPDDRDAHRKLALLVDVSASMLGGARVGRAKQLAAALLDALPASASVQLLPFDILPRRGPAGLRAGELAAADGARIRALREWLEEQEASGGSAFVPAFEAALRARAQQIVLITDGASANHQAELEHLLRQIFDQRGVTVSLVLIGARQDAGAQIDPLRDMVRLTGGVFARRPDATGVETLVRRLLARPQPRTARALAAGVPIEGASLHVLPGASLKRVLVAGRVPSTTRELQVLLADGRRHAVELPGPADPGPQARDAGALWAHAEIGRLMQQIKLFSEEDKLRPRIVALSKRHRVASEYTAYLVTETDADYLRPTSGRKWQRQVKRMGDGAPPPSSFHSTPEPHEVLLVGLGLLLLWAARRRGWIGAS
jgi:Ca-activated chloride channel family protein